MSTPLTIGIQKARDTDFSARWAEAIEARGGRVKWLDLLGELPLDQVAGCDGVMWHWGHVPHGARMAALPLLRVIEEQLHLPIFPDMATCWHFDDKISQAYLLKALEIPQPETWIFWERGRAMDWAETAVYPVVAKLLGGAGGTNVKLLRTQREARAYVRRCFSGSGILVRPALPEKWAPRLWTHLKRAVKRAVQVVPYLGWNRFPSLPSQSGWMPQKDYALFQEFLPGNTFDTRVTIIGNRAFAFRRMNRPDDFRASGSGNIQQDPKAIDLRCVSAAFDAAKKLRSQSMAFDFLYRGEDPEPLIGEISYGYSDWAVEQCPGHWDADLSWHEGRLWPEEAHVEDFLKQIQAPPGSLP